MKEKIKKICKDIEKEKKIKILFCVESGSRSWRLSSKDSDYDIRFVFIRPMKEYLKIDSPSDVIMKSYDKEGKPMSQEGCIIDMCGFDIYKYCKMLNSSNPTVIEWIQSDILYYGRRPNLLIDFVNREYNPISLYHHYKSMCKQNYLKYLKSGNLVTYKKYLYAMRGLINAKYITLGDCVGLPFIDFNRTLEYFEDLRIHTRDEIIPKSIIHKLQEIIKLKREGNEKDIIQNINKIDNYIESFLKEDLEIESKKKHRTNKEFNDFILRKLKEVSGTKTLSPSPLRSSGNLIKC